MKKILCAILSFVMILSVMTTAVIGVSADTATTQTFDSADSFTSDSGAVSLVGNSAFKMSYPENMENAYNQSNIIKVSPDMWSNSESGTITFKVRADYELRQTSNGTVYWYGMKIAFSMNTWNNPPSTDYITLMPNKDDPNDNTDGINMLGSDSAPVSGQWYRIDVLYDRTNGDGDKGTYAVYVDGTYVQTITRTGGKQHIDSIYICPIGVGSPRAACDYYLDDVLIRKGVLCEPSQGDAYSRGDAAEITALDGVLVYNEMNELPHMYNYSSAVDYSIVNLDSYLSVESKAGAAAASATVPMTIPAGNATVDFKLKADFADTGFAKADLALADNAKAGITVWGSKSVSWSDADAMLTTYDLEKTATITAGKWHDVRMVVNRTMGKLTVYIDGKEYIWTDLDEAATLNGLYIDVAANGTSDVTYCIDDLSVQTGMYAPDATAEMASRNVRMIGHQRSLDAGTTMDLRFIAAVEDVNAYTSMGINVKATGKVATDFPVKAVYTGVNAKIDNEDVTYTASDWGYTYVFVADLTGVPVGGVREFTVTPYAYDGETRIDFAPITVTYDGAVAQ